MCWMAVSSAAGPAPVAWPRNGAITNRHSQTTPSRPRVRIYGRSSVADPTGSSKCRRRLGEQAGRPDSRCYAAGMRRVEAPMKRLLLSCLAVLFAAAGCTSGTPSASRPSSAQTSSVPSATPTLQPTSAPSSPVTVQTWFVRGGKLFESTRVVPRTPAIGRGAVVAMLAGPSAAEEAAGVSSRIDASTTVTSLRIANGTARVSLSSHAESDPLSDAQVVYTLSQFPTVKQVIVNGQEGGPLSRTDLASH